MDNTKTALIIGAGPAGLTAALELLETTDIKPIICEATDSIGGIAKTYNHHGNRMDMGGHRFFSKSEKVMDWWLKIMPLQGCPSRDDLLLQRTNKQLSELPNAPDPELTDQVMLLRERLSRIFYQRSFFDYPVSLNATTIKNLGIFRIMKAGFSYIKARILPIKPEKSLEDFMINRFGRELYLTFFRDYTTKVWGVSPSQIQPDWGAQRIKGLSVTKVLWHALKKLSPFGHKTGIAVQQKGETSLIEQFVYPKYGPGHLWEEVARRIEAKGGRILKRHPVTGLTVSQAKIISLKARNLDIDEEVEFTVDYVISSMPVKDLINAFSSAASPEIQRIANGLVYRDFITAGLLLKKLQVQNRTSIKTVNQLIPDLWIYIQEPDVKIGRLQIFNNWSPYLIDAWQENIWMGLEYFANEGDELWEMPEQEFISFAINELEKIGIIDSKDVLDSCQVKVPKAYPAYFGTYDQFNQLRQYTDGFANLFLIGRNGMHRYNNMDHSMLTAMAAVENIRTGKVGKENIWDVNAEQDYHEAKKSDR